MVIKTTKSFDKDVELLSDKKTKDKLFAFISLLENAPDLRNINNLKALQGFPSFYRWRCGDYRLGFRKEGNIIYLRNFLPRKTIYKIFP